METPSRHTGPTVSLLALGLALGTLACAATPEPESRPPFTTEVDHYPGTLLTGPQAELGEAEEQGAWAFSLRTGYVAVVPEEFGEALAASARLVLAERGAEPLRTRGELSVGVRVLQPEEELPTALWQERRLDVLIPGATTVWRAVRDPLGDFQGQVSWEGFGLELSRNLHDPSHLELALSFDGYVRPRRTADPDALEAEDEGARVEPEPPLVRQRERVLLDRAPAPDGTPLRFVLPAPAPQYPRGGYFAELRVLPGPLQAGLREPLLAAEEHARARLAAVRDVARDSARRLDATEAFRSESAGALIALAQQGSQRRALLFLAQLTSAELAGELALCADDEDLAAFLLYLLERFEADDPAERDSASLSWYLEEATWSWLVAQLLDPERAEAAVGRSLLLRHAGELGRYPELVLEAIAGCTGVADLDGALERENLIFLEDGHPAARVRAFDWLTRRGKAPAGYDPLAERRERRAALQAAEADLAAEGGQR